MRCITERPNLLSPASVGSKQPSPRRLRALYSDLHDPQPAGMEDIDEVEAIFDRLRPLKVQHDADLAPRLRGSQVLHRAREAYSVAPCSIDLEPLAEHRHGGLEIFDRRSRREDRVDAALLQQGKALRSSSRG